MISDITGIRHKDGRVTVVTRHRSPSAARRHARKSDPDVHAYPLADTTYRAAEPEIGDELAYFDRDGSVVPLKWAAS